MLSGWRWLTGSHRIDQTCFQSRMLFQVEPFGLLAIRLILVDRAEIGFLSHCLPSPFSVTEANGSQVEFVPWRPEKDKALSLTSPRPDAGNAFRVTPKDPSESGGRADMMRSMTGTLWFLDKLSRNPRKG